MKNQATIIFNSVSRGHKEAVLQLLREADRFDCAIAFAKWSGFSIISEIETLKPEILDKYKKEHEAYHMIRRQADRRIRIALSQDKPGIASLRDILREMREGGSNSEFHIRVRDRIASRKEARFILNKIKAMPTLRRTQFLTLYGRLASGLWHSGGLHRGKTRIAEHSDIFKRIVKTAAQLHTGSVSIAFERLHELSMKVPGIGPNVITEILHTFDNTRFAVMNQNSVSGIQQSGNTTFPKKPSKSSVNGALYAEFCESANVIRTKLGLKTLSELDAVFDYAYWQGRGA